MSSRRPTPLYSAMTVVCVVLFLPACAALFGPGLTPEQKAFRQAAVADRPDMTGQWQSSKAGVTLDIRHKPSNPRALTVNVSSPSGTPVTWSVYSAAVDPPLAAGEGWKVLLTTDHPDRKPTKPGQLVSQRDRATGQLSEGRDRVTFPDGDVWTRIGAVAALELPPAGKATFDLELTGPVLTTLSIPSGTASECTSACEKNAKCAATVFIGRECKLLSSVGRPKERRQAVAWINPNFGQAGAAQVELPPPGVATREVQLTGLALKSINVGSRGARRRCEMACKDDWSCKGFSVEPFKGSCELLKEVQGAKKAPGWEATLASARAVAVAPDFGQYSEDTRMVGAELETRTFPFGALRDCEAACLSHTDCKAVSWLRDKVQCHLHRAGGAPEAAQHWVAWTRPKPPPDMSVPPDQTMSSPLCAQHARAFPAYVLSTEGIPRGAPSTWNQGHLDVPEVYQPTDAPFRIPTYTRLPEGKAPFTAAFYLRALPGGLVHLHSWYNPEMVLKRVGDQVVVGPVDEDSTWRLEALFEYFDPDPNSGAGWMVIRHPGDGRFLTLSGTTVELGLSPLVAGTHWRPGHMLLPGQKAEEWTEIPLMQPPPSPLDPVVLQKLTDWAMQELARQELPACWKPGGAGPCPAGQDTNCGLFCARSEEQCVLDVTNMVVSVTEIAANIGGAVFTGGSANAALAGAKAAAKTATKAGLKTMVRQSMKVGARAMRAGLKKKLGKSLVGFMKTKGRTAAFKNLALNLGASLSGNLAWSIVQSATLNVRPAVSPAAMQKAEDDLAEAYAVEVAARTAERLALKIMVEAAPDLMDIIAIVDPTGVVGAVQSFNKPQCVQTPMPQL